MWYHGRASAGKQGALPLADPSFGSVGLAESSNGILWSRYDLYSQIVSVFFDLVQYTQSFIFCSHQVEFERERIEAFFLMYEKGYSHEVFGTSQCWIVLLCIDQLSTFKETATLML
jgi:hypothetical protein